MLRAELRRAAETAYENAFAEASDGMMDGTLLHGEVLARWEDCVVGGDLRPRRAAKPARSGSKKGKRARRGPSRSAALNAALRSAIESYIVSVADRAAEAVEGSWRADPAGAVLLADAAAERARDVRAKQVFESVFGPAGQSGGGDPAEADIKAADVIKAADAAQVSAFSRSSPDLALRATRAIGAWQDHLTRLVEGEDLRPAAARRISFDARGAGPGGPGGDARRGSTRWCWARWYWARWMGLLGPLVLGPLVLGPRGLCPLGLCLARLGPRYRPKPMAAASTPNRGGC